MYIIYIYKIWMCILDHQTIKLIRKRIEAFKKQNTTEGP